MNMRWVIVAIALICLIVPSMAINVTYYLPSTINYNANGNVRWTDQQGNTITSAYVGDVVKFNFVVDDPAAPNGSELLTFYVEEYNDQTGVWNFNSVPLNVYGVFDNATYAPIWGFQSAYWMNHTSVKGYANYTILDGHSKYKIDVRTTSINASSVPYGYYLYEWSNATITASDNPIAFTNFGDWIKSIGGEGLAYAFAVVIIVFFVILPYLLMRTFNLYIELFMVALAIVISLFLNLIGLWVVFGLGIGSLAIYLLINKSGAGGQ